MVKYQHNQPYYELHFSELPEDAVMVLSFKGEENISRLFSYEFDLLSKEEELDPEKILNKTATFIMNRGDEDPIQIHGIISKFIQRGRTSNYVSYSAVLVPKMWLLKLTYISEVYQKMDIEKIITQVLKNSGFSSQDYRFDLNESYPELEYIVQFQESNFDFVNRRLEHFGIFYYFDHRDGTDVIVFTDTNDSLPAIESSDDIFYNSNRDPLSEKETISEITCEAQVVTGMVQLKDYNYRFPSKDLSVQSQKDTNAPGVYYEYGGHFQDTKQGEFLAKVRNEEILSQSKIFKGKSDCRLFRSGFKFKMGEHYRSDWNDSEYILTRVLSYGTQRGLFAVLPKQKKVIPTFENYFEAIPLDVKYRPPRITSIPKLHGIMNSTTEAAQGEKYAYVDDQGRYRLKMPFDLSGSSVDEASQAVRLASPHAGAGYGMHFPQHAGVEISWSCIDGNVDRPIGLGTVPNPSTSSPVNNSNKSRNVLKTSSGNTLEMEDSGGGEQIVLSTPYENSSLRLGSAGDSGGEDGIALSTDAHETISVGLNREMSIDKNDTVTIKKNRKISIKGKKNETVKKNVTIKIGGKLTETIKKNVSIKTPKNHSTAVGKNAALKVKKNIKISSNKNISIGAKKNIAVGAKKNIGVGAKKDIKIAAEKKISVGAKQDISAKTDKNLKVSTKKNTNFLVTKHFNAVSKKKVAIAAKDKLMIKSNKQIVLKCGSGSITMKQDGSIKIKGLKIQIQGQTDLKMKALKITSQASVSNKIKGTMVNVEASGINTIKGSLVKIN